MRTFVLYLFIALAVTLPALIMRLGSWHPAPLLAVGLFGSAILAAGFMLSWGAETAERFIAQGLILALVALITVLPEYAVDFYYAFQAGRDPQSLNVHYAAANMTGANRLLVGLAWPLMVLLNRYKTRQSAIVLAPGNRLEIGFLLLASLYAFVIVFKNRIDLLDTVILGSLFGGYLWRVSRLPKTDEDEADEPGPAAAILTLPPRQQWGIIGGLTLVAGTVILVSAEPFAESIVLAGVLAGRQLGVDEFLLIQWLAPLASEAPTVSIAVLFVLAGRATSGLAAMISDKINQWTLLVGMLPLAMSAGASGWLALPLDARQHEEFFLTAAQSLFGVALLLGLRLTLGHATALLLLFSVQVLLAFHFQDNPAVEVATLTYLGWAYLALASVLVISNRAHLKGVVTQLWTGSSPPAPDQ